MKKIDIEKGSKRADARFRITVEETGPYLIYGQPPLAQQFIMPDAEGESWYFQQGAHFPTDDEPTALCRCGASKNKPYCDGAHVHAAWDPRLTADDAPLLDNVELTEGETLSMTDNPKYCVFARFCDAKGQAWNLVGQPENDEARELAIREGFDVPQRPADGVDNETGTPYEFRFEPSLGTHLKDVAIGASQRPVGARRNSRQPRIGRDLRDPQPRRAVPLPARRTTSPTATARTPRSGSTTGSKGLPKAKPSPKKSTDRRGGTSDAPAPTIHPCRNIPAGVIFIRGIMRFHVAVRRFVSADLPSAARAERNFQSCIPFSRPDKGKPLSERNEVQKRNLSFFGDSPARTAH